MKILLTGSSGMVGRNILEHPGAVLWTWLTPSHFTLDLCDRLAVRAYLAQEKPDMIVHAAGLVGGIQANQAHGLDFMVANMQMAENLFLEAAAAKIPRVLNLGSSCMYPKDYEGLLTEDMLLKGPLEPTNEGYALAKIVAAKLCEYLCKEDTSLQYKTLILCNLYGRWDKFNPAQSHLLPAIIFKTHQAMVQQQQTITIWGNGTARREFLYATDLAECILQAIGRFETLPEMCNVGLGQDYSILDYYQAVATEMGFSGEFVFDLTKPVGMRRKVVSVARLHAWGWQSKTALPVGISHTVAFFKENIDPVTGGLRYALPIGQ